MAGSLPESIELELTLDDAQDTEALRGHVARKLGVTGAELPPVRLLKRALDCRRRRVRFHLLCSLVEAEELELPLVLPEPVDVKGTPRVVIVGDGPCGLFCAYQLAREGIASVVLDRGKPVQARRKDLKGLTKRSTVDPDSNYCFGEGGAGTYSDGKLYTRSHKRGDVRDVIEILAAHGAPSAILTEARPHIGSNLLPAVVTGLRERLEGVGVEFRFGARVVDIPVSNSLPKRVLGVVLASGEQIEADAVVLATGHSARDIYQLLDDAGLPLESKPFALGVRIEHPQPLIDEIQYGRAAGHPALPSANYRLVDGKNERAVFSFCMCPGGFIVPASTAPGEVVVNGMSPSRRNSRYANSGIVVSVDPRGLSGAAELGALVGVHLQRGIEQRAFEAGGGTLAAPATRLTDWLERRGSTTLPDSSYVPGLVPTDVAEVLDSGAVRFAERLREGLRRFGQQMPGFITRDAVLVGVESRTSSPVRIPRHPEALVSPAWQGLYPGGEGAGFAGGIVSAAVDGMRIARAIARSQRCG
jgi:hypothetical protein